MWDSAINLGKKSDRSEKERKMKKIKRNFLPSIIFSDLYQHISRSLHLCFSRGESFAMCPLHLSVHPEVLLRVFWQSVCPLPTCLFRCCLWIPWAEHGWLMHAWLLCLGHLWTFLSLQQCVTLTDKAVFKLHICVVCLISACRAVPLQCCSYRSECSRSSSAVSSVLKKLPLCDPTTPSHSAFVA